MDRYEREELAELILRAVNTATTEATAMYDRPSDMGWWVDTAESARTARRELWEALYRLEISTDLTQPVRKRAPKRPETWPGVYRSRT